MFAFLGAHGRRYGERRGLNFTGEQRDNGFRLAAGLDHGDVPFGIEAVFFQSETRCEIRQRAEARRAEELALEISDSSDFRPAENREQKLLENRRDDHRVRAGQIGLHRRRATELNDRHFSGKHRLHRHGTSRNRDRLDGQAVLLVKTCLLGKPHRHLRRAHRTAADANPFELFVLRAGVTNPNRRANENHCGPPEHSSHKRLLRGEFRAGTD